MLITKSQSPNVEMGHGQAAELLRSFFNCCSYQSTFEPTYNNCPATWGSRRVLFWDRILKAWLKTLSEGAEVACTARNFLANNAKRGKCLPWTFHHIKGLLFFSTSPISLYWFHSDLHFCSGLFCCMSGVGMQVPRFLQSASKESTESSLLILYLVKTYSN